MSKSKKIWLGIFTFSPILVTILAIISFLGAILTGFAGAASGNEEIIPFLFAGGIFSFFILILFAALADLIVTIYFIADVIQDDSIEDVEKIIWVLALFFVSFISTAVYWVVRIWNRKKGGFLNNKNKFNREQIIDI
ncbi:hypothetical protein Fleli_3093 [Bernardetia litoralis DSM 6794]|uniref:Cardiolipin synthase N-terminal domain-containing protein n=1 Tax=Bernardetia litoralis (strain ATCC 23117 / DSM 6794 / NBRC 15988 / NCIMB 1366 / Fx l1 / Sio-4) TaxID=880071 RepID=I4AN98_BERLS|nr:PLDc N-terminal domain-containing protein [Bernardetia litoralis]AFM05433.1 hypothetical protein Fleli_3093 [Bernardetia litoralis DSM 6794]